MNARQKKTLEQVFQRPTLASIEWLSIESLLIALGAKVREGNGSRVRVTLNGVNASFHRPHPRKECGRKMVDAIRDFLIATGVVSDGI